MVTSYVSDAGDIVVLDFDPQVVLVQAKQRPALVLTHIDYNLCSGLAVRCQLASKRKTYPFAVPVKVGGVEGAVLADQLKSIDWAGRRAEFHSKAGPVMLTKVRQYVAVLLSIPTAQRP